MFYLHEFSFMEKLENEISWSNSRICLLAVANVTGIVNYLSYQCILNSPGCWISRPDCIIPEKKPQKLPWLIFLTRRKKIVQCGRSIFHKWYISLYLQQHNVILLCTGVVAWITNAICNLKNLLFFFTSFQWMGSKSNFAFFPEERTT